MWKFAKCSSASVEDRKSGIGRLKSLRNNATSQVPKSQSPPPVVTTDSNGARKQHDERKSAHNIFRAFRKKVFSEKLGEDAM